MGLPPSASRTSTFADASLSLDGSRGVSAAATVGTAATSAKTRVNRRFITGNLKSQQPYRISAGKRQSSSRISRLYPSSRAAQGGDRRRGRCGVSSPNGLGACRVDTDVAVGRRRTLRTLLVLLEAPHPGVRPVGGQQRGVAAA